MVCLSGGRKLAEKADFCYSISTMMSSESPTESVSNVPWVLFVLGLLWFGSLEFIIRQHRLGLFIAAGMAVAISTYAVVQWRRRTSTNVASLAIMLTVIITLAGMSFAPGIWAQHTVAILSVLLLLLISRLRLRQHDDLRGRTTAYITAFFIWMSWFCLLSASIYLNLNLAWLVVGAGFMTAIAALLVWMESGIPLKHVRRGLLAMAIFGAELFVVLWWLPTTTYVGSAVATTIVALVIQASRHLWKGHWEPGRSRRYFVVGLSVMMLVLLTARWL